MSTTIYKCWSSFTNTNFMITETPKTKTKTLENVTTLKTS